LGIFYGRQRRYAEAEPLYLRSLAIREKALGPSHPDVGASLNRLAQFYRARGRYAEAEPLYKRALTIYEKALGLEHPWVGTSLNDLAGLYRAQGRYAEAEPLHKRALAIYEKALGLEHPWVGTSLNDLAGLYRAQGRYAEAEPLYERSLAIREKALGPDHPEVGTSLNNLASQYEAQGRYAEAESLYKRALVIAEKVFGDDHPDVGRAINNLALLYRAQGRYAEAESLYKRALVIAEKLFGDDHPTVGTVLDNLAVLFRTQGRAAEAEPLYLRSLAIREKALGPSHPDVGTGLDNLAEFYRAQGRYLSAEPLYKRSLNIREKALGPDHPAVGTSLNNLASQYEAQGRYAEAESLYKRALAIYEKALGPDHRDVGTAVNNLALLYSAQGRYAEAEPLYKRALVIAERELGADHPVVGVTLWSLAVLSAAREDGGAALAYQRRATAIRIKRGEAGGDRGVGGKLELAQGANYFRFHVLAADRAGGDRSALLPETFEMAQWALQTEAADALAHMGARFAAGGGALAGPVRERQDLARRRQTADRWLSAAAGKADAVGAEAARNDIAAVDAQLDALDQRLARDFPDYTQLVSPKPLDIAATQASLKADEVLVLFLDVPGPEETYAWVVTKTAALWLKLSLTPSQIAESVGTLRCGLDHTLWTEHESANGCKAALQASPREEIVKSGDKDMPVQVLPFDVARAHELYKALLGPVEDVIKGKHLLVVPSGALTSLPFHLLVTEPPKMANPAKFLDFRGVAWLGAHQPITVLPSVASLKALRQFAKTSRATKPYLGIGNPLLDGRQDHPRYGSHYKKLAQESRNKQQCPKTFRNRVAVATARPVSGFAKLFRGNQADIEQVRAFSPLPETADELCEVGRRLGVPESAILLGDHATETAMKELSVSGKLADYAILHFATHGALSGQVQGSAEPGLILTPPPRGTDDPKALERDDGFLTASEIATLKMDADWVVLSACNTAGSSGETAEALSGMTRAFFYAGARALLVSHWEVNSIAAVKLTTKAFAEIKADASIGRADALRRAMVALIERGEPHEAHPAYWAPFVLVGEGSADVLASPPLATSSINPGPVPPKKAAPSAPQQTRPSKRVAPPDWRTEIWRE
jgi:tetratricopeptide (TPR) repeat protein/CHAT domain-containing protein